MTRTRLRLAAFGCLYLFWGSTYPAIRFLVGHVRPFLLSGARQFCAGLILIALARWRGSPFPTKRQWLGGAALGFVFLVLCNGVSAWALQYIQAGKATLLTACVPLVALSYGWSVQGRKVRPAELACLLVGLAGVCLLIRPSAGPDIPHWPWGVAAILWTVVVWSIGMSETARFPQVSDRVMASGVQLLSGGCVMLAVAGLSGQTAATDLGALTWMDWSAWAYLIVFGSCVGYLCFNWLVTHESPQLAGTYAFVNPVVAVFLGWAFLHEALTWTTVLATLLIVGSVAVSLWLASKKAMVEGR